MDPAGSETTVTGYLGACAYCVPGLSPPRMCGIWTAGLPCLRICFDLLPFAAKHDIPLYLRDVVQIVLNRRDERPLELIYEYFKRCVCVSMPSVGAMSPRLVPACTCLVPLLLLVSRKLVISLSMFGCCGGKHYERVQRDLARLPVHSLDASQSGRVDPQLSAEPLPCRVRGVYVLPPGCGCCNVCAPPGC